MNLLTPILTKQPGDAMTPSDEPAYYLLTSSGLFLCRNDAFYRSCAPARQWPGELAPHASFLEPRFPRLSQRDCERIVGFFRAIAERHRAEAAVLLAWHRTERRVVLIVPPQQANSMRVAYDVPRLADPQLVLFGDVHSHVDSPAFASQIDAEDELNRPGLHIVVGRVRRPTPEFYVAAVVDGMRFELELADVSEGFAAAATQVPAEWLDAVTVKPGYSSWYGEQPAATPAPELPGGPPSRDVGPFVLRPGEARRADGGRSTEGKRHG
ncbi:MAG TPA: Mov34/MPN/PAD-1 family protein [Planctomycetota bacterium]